MGEEGTDKPRKHRLDPSAAILIAVTTPATAWGTLQSSAWSVGPAGLSSPLASLKTSLDAGDSAAAFTARDCLPSQSSTEFNHLFGWGNDCRPPPGSAAASAAKPVPEARASEIPRFNGGVADGRRESNLEQPSPHDVTA